LHKRSQAGNIKARTKGDNSYPKPLLPSKKNMAASRFDCHISADSDAKKSSMTKSLYRFYAGYTG